MVVSGLSPFFGQFALTSGKEIANFPELRLAFLLSENGELSDRCSDVNAEAGFFRPLSKNANWSVTRLCQVVIVLGEWDNENGT
jgi:hypothetical protein